MDKVDTVLHGVLLVSLIGIGVLKVIRYVKS